MKRLLFVLAATSLLLVSCSKDGGTVADPSNGATAVESAAPRKAASGRPAYILLQGLSLWTKDGGNAVWAKSGTLADAVTIIGGPESLEYKGAKRDYVKIAMPDGAEYYARSPYIVEAVKLAVVSSEKCVLHNEPRIIGATVVDVPYLTVVAVLDETITDGFVKVSYANADSAMISEKWIKRDAIVNGELDVGAAVSLAVVNAIDEKNKDLRINILEGAASAYAESAFADDIGNLLLSLKGPGSGVSDARIDTVEAKVSGVINDEAVNVRSAPSVDGGSLGKLSRGDDVEAVERTAATYDVGGVSDNWYHIVKPVDGWVFGSFIDFGSVDN